MPAPGAEMTHPFLALTDSDREEMLATVGVPAVDELFRDLPEAVRLGRELLEVADDLLLGQGGLEVELAVEAHARGDVAEELVHRRDADRREHLVAVALGERQVPPAHCSARTCLYASRSRSDSTSDGSDSRMRTSQPSP